MSQHAGNEPDTAKTALIPIADGIEEMEAVVIIDILRRAGWKVFFTALGPLTITASRGVRISADIPWNDADPVSCSCLVLPGGREGVRSMAADCRVLDAVRHRVEHRLWTGAICAAPLVLQAAGVLRNRRITCHPAVVTELEPTVTWVSERVVLDGNIVTSQGPGTAMDFALTLVRLLDGAASEQTLRTQLVLQK